VVEGLFERSRAVPAVTLKVTAEIRQLAGSFRTLVGGPYVFVGHDVFPVYLRNRVGHDVFPVYLRNRVSHDVFPVYL